MSKNMIVVSKETLKKINLLKVNLDCSTQNEVIEKLIEVYEKKNKKRVDK